jgi:Glyoxalase-like domain
VLFRWLTLFLDFPAEAFDAGVAFWREVTGSELSPFRGPAGEFATLLPAAADAYLRVQRTADGSSGCHLDLHVDPAAGTVDQAADRAVALGATVRHVSEGLVIADSPGGFTFCLVRSNGENTVPPPTSLNTGGASRADQLCLDIPPDAFERECAFWAALTGWDLRAGTRPEFAYLDRPARMPIRLLLQRRDHADPLDQVTGHVDFACASRELLAARHAASGARIVSASSHWITMADPAGHLYCLTGRDPQTGRLPAPAA